MATFDSLEQPHPEALLALSLIDAGARRPMIPYLAGKLRDQGYTSAIMQSGLPQAIGRLRDDFTACFETDEERAAAKPGTYENFKQRMALEEAFRKRMQGAQ